MTSQQINIITIISQELRSNCWCNNFLAETFGFQAKKIICNNLILKLLHQNSRAGFDGQAGINQP